MQIGANLALDAHTFQMETWVEKYGDDHGFEEYWDDTEPSYLAQLDPPAYDISVADQLEYVRLLGDIAEMDTVENGARVAEFEGGRNDLGLALHRFLNRFTPAEHEDSPVFDHTKNVISFHNRNILTLDVFNEEIRSQLAPLKYPGTGIMVEDPQVRASQFSRTFSRQLFRAHCSLHGPTAQSATRVAFLVVLGYPCFGKHPTPSPTYRRRSASSHSVSDPCIAFALCIAFKWRPSIALMLLCVVCCNAGSYCPWHV